jgi:hypothetical protein
MMIVDQRSDSCIALAQAGNTTHFDFPGPKFSGKILESLSDFWCTMNMARHIPTNFNACAFGRFQLVQRIKACYFMNAMQGYTRALGKRMHFVMRQIATSVLNFF